MNVYIYQADLWCEACGRAIKAQPDVTAPADPEDESSYDSDEYPKGPYPDGGGEADTPQHCAAGPACVNALELDGNKYGMLLENPLTKDGREYVREAVKRGGPLATYWAEEYAEQLV
ncbi:MAG: hypothetical protein U0990_09320 [Candidatus Nanopelagicales bacterium]|nr:hypothetical protein [Candidatus Nanopelagicales bacterium]